MSGCVNVQGIEGCIPVPWDENNTPAVTTTETANASGASVTTTPLSKINIQYVILALVILVLILEVYELVKHK